MSAKIFFFRLFISTIFLISPFFRSIGQSSDWVPTDQETISAGEAIFNTTCITCHDINDKIIGPPLAGVYNRLEKDWLISWTRNSRAMIESGDEYANKIFNEYFQVEMILNDMTDDEIISIFAYVRAQDEGAAGGGDAAQAETGAAADAGGGADQELAVQGKTLFEETCKVCHTINEKLIGPALRDVHKRRDETWIKAFITNSQMVINSGDDYAVKLYEEYSKTLMPPHDFFSDSELQSIIEYIKAESERPAEAATVADAAGAPGEPGAGTAEVPDYIVAILVALLVVMILVLGAVLMIIPILKKYLEGREDLDEADQEIVRQRFDLQAVLKSNYFLFFVAFIFIGVGFKSCIEVLFTIGVQQGYAPTQPIAYSHKVHAGQYEIDCNYCHTGVRKGKNANIPSLNICMNCHQEIQEGTNTGKNEIAKIYAALDYDPQTRTYGPNPKPIEWVRIHNLPDLAYFNHAQHVKVGNIECETCHGEIKEMEVVAQHAPLTMGWCINCHRETKVNTKGNAYYDNLVLVHNQKSKQPMTVENIGGVECSKCHY